MADPHRFSSEKISSAAAGLKREPNPADKTGIVPRMALVRAMNGM
jgi:hypothetical protein